MSTKHLVGAILARAQRGFKMPRPDAYGALLCGEDEYEYEAKNEANGEQEKHWSETRLGFHAGWAKPQYEDGYRERPCSTPMKWQTESMGRDG